jgi:predicted DNA-binding protein (MmcQ/YjbR family)
MTVDTIRSMCRALPDVTEDIKWGHDLCFCIAGKMFTVVSLEHPHSIAFKCTPESFAELVERPGIIPAPYMARHLWVQEQELGEAFDRQELEPLIKTAYALVAAKLPKGRRSVRKNKKKTIAVRGRSARRRVTTASTRAPKKK